MFNCVCIPNFRQAEHLCYLRIPVEDLEQLFIYSVAVVNIVSMATGKTLITHSFEVGKSKYLVEMFLGRVAVAKRIFMPNINFVRLGIREF